MENWKNIIKLIEKWHKTKYDRLADTREDLFIEELNSKYILINKDDVDKIEIVYKPGIEPSEDIIYCDADHEAMHEITKEIHKTTDPLSEEEWENIIDERAEEEVELNDAKTKDIPWNRLMPNKDTFSEKQANVIINNPDLFL